MDTKLKKFNLSALFKLVAVALCLLCIGGTVTQLVSSLLVADERMLGLNNFTDAVYQGKNQPVWQTESFKSEYNRYMSEVAQLISVYGDGSEEAYKIKTDAIINSNNKSFENAKKNLVALVEQREGFFDYLVAISSGDIVNCGFIETSDKLDQDNFFYDDEIYDADVDYEWISRDSIDVDRNYNVDLTDAARKKMDETKADGVFYLSSAGYVIDSTEEDAEVFYPPGYYFFKLDEERLFANLVENSVIEDDIETFEQFSKEYKKQADYIKQLYPSGRYFVRDVKGNTFTNVKSLNKESTKKEIASAFTTFGFYTTENDSYTVVDSSGAVYSGWSFMGQLESEVFSEGVVHYYNDVTSVSVPVTLTTTLPTTTVPETTMETTVPTTAAEGATVATTVPPTVAPVPTTAKNNYNGKSAFVYLTENASDMDIFIGVDINSKAYINKECRFSQVQNKIILARDMAKDTVKTCGTLVLLFIALLIFLVLYSGRRFGDRENVYMFRLDSMFTDLRILLDCGAGLLIGLAVVWILDEFYSEGNANDTINLILGVVCAAFGAVVLDLVLFITRHIKNRTLFKKLSVVWIFEKIFRKLSEKTSKAISIKNKLLTTLLVLLVPVNVLGVMWICGPCDNEYELLLVLFLMFVYDFLTACLFVKEKHLLVPIMQKMQYVKGFEKETVIKGAIVLAVNIFLGFLAVVEIANTETLWFSFALLGFDIFVCVQLVRFIAGVKKIFTAVNEIKEGNYDVQINLFAIPSSLHEPANKLMSLRDGLKTAVEEAVKQEQTKTELITNVSHDLKTPLTSVINYVELLKKCNIEDEDAKEYLQILGEKSDRLKKLIEDLVEASKASTGNLKVEFVEVSLNEITSQIIGEFSDTFEEKGLSLITAFPEENITVRADSKMLYRVLENLMGNVSKYAMANTRVYLSVEKRNGKGVISVKNISGSPLNITASELKARFVRGDESRTTEGSGLGLSIAESLCNLMGGRLNIIINGDLFVAEVEIPAK